MKKIMVVFLSLAIAQLVQAEIPLIKLYGLREETALKQLINAEQSTAKTPVQQKRLGIAWHNLAVLEESGAAEKAFNILKPLRKELPKDYEVLAYLGSSQTMIARDSWNPVTKISYANKGITLLDKAVSKDKDNVVIRVIRMNNSLALPGFLGRSEKVKPDLEYSLKLFNTTEVPAETSSEVYLKMGQLLLEQGEKEQAQAYFKKAIEIAPNSVWAQQARDAMNG